MRPVKTCTEEGCGRRAHRGALCESHRTRRRAGRAQTTVRAYVRIRQADGSQRTCKNDDKPAVASGLCRVCYDAERWMRRKLADCA